MLGHQTMPLIRRDACSSFLYVQTLEWKNLIKLNQKFYFILIKLYKIIYLSRSFLPTVPLKRLVYQFSTR